MKNQENWNKLTAFLALSGFIIVWFEIIPFIFSVIQMTVGFFYLFIHDDNYRESVMNGIFGKQKWIIDIYPFIR